jgi:hypothetical protein
MDTPDGKCPRTAVLEEGMILRALIKFKSLFPFTQYPISPRKSAEKGIRIDLVAEMNGKSGVKLPHAHELAFMDQIEFGWGTDPIFDFKHSVVYTFSQ